jgi:hypothetical protein
MSSYWRFSGPISLFLIVYLRFACLYHILFLPSMSSSEPKFNMFSCPIRLVDSLRAFASTTTLL